MALFGDYVIFSSDPTDLSMPHFELVITNVITELAVYIPGYGYLPPAETPLIPGEPYQLGCRYWFDDGHHWEYIVMQLTPGVSHPNGIVEAGTGPVLYASPDDINLNVVSVFADLGVSPLAQLGVSIPGRKDDVRFWQHGNLLNDNDVHRVSLWVKDMCLSIHSLPAISAFITSSPAILGNLFTSSTLGDCVRT